LKTVRFEQHESNDFRVVHADGAYGGPTPNGLLYTVFYTQTPAIPSTLVHEIKEDGNIGEEIVPDRVISSAIERRIEFGVLMDLNLTKSFHKWLGQQIAQIENLVASAPVAEKK
jgi:hypothetical protein